MASSEAQEPPVEAPGETSVDFSFAFLNRRFSDCTLRLHLPDLSIHDEHGLLNASGAANSHVTSTSTRITSGQLAPDSIRQLADKEEKQGEECQGDRLSLIPVSSLVLVAKSAFFEKLFTGSFQEGDDNSEIDVILPAADELAFMALLESFYSCALPQRLASDLFNLLRFVVLADRFQAGHSLSLATSALQRLTPFLTPGDALLILGLPESVLQNPKFDLITSSATDRINSAYSGVLKGLMTVSGIEGERKLPGSRGQKKGLLDLSERDLGTLLQVDTLEVETEDTVAEAALAWVYHNYADRAEQAEVVCRLVLPRVRLLSLSPPILNTLCSLASFHIKSKLRGTVSCDTLPPGKQPLEGEGAHRDEQESTASGGMWEWQKSMSKKKNSSSNYRRSNIPSEEGRVNHTSGLSATSSEPLSQQPRSFVPQLTAFRRSRSSSEPSLGAQPHKAEGKVALGTNLPSLEIGGESKASAAELAIDSLTSALLALSEQKHIEKGALASGTQLSSLKLGIVIPLPRPACEPPHGTLYVEVPVKRCREWVPSNAFLATSSHTLIRGRWFTLNIQVCAGNSSLGMYLMWDKNAGSSRVDSKSKATGFELDYQFCVQTSDSIPAYEHVVKSRVAFSESAMGWGRANVLGKSWSAFLQETDTYFPEGGLRLRADVWIVREGEQRNMDNSPDR